MTLTVGSLCTGYGGIEQALTLAGVEHRLAWVADNDPGAEKVLAYRYPETPNLGDITAVDWAVVERVDLLTAGFPCTDVSLAGLGAGLVADRWRLPDDAEELPCGCFPMNHKVWCEDVSPLGHAPASCGIDDAALAAVTALNDRDRAANPQWLVKGTRSGVWSYVAHAIAVLRPSYVLLENVRGLLSARADSDVEPCPWCLGDRGGGPQRACFASTRSCTRAAFRSRV